MKNKRRIAGIVFLIIALMLGGISYSMSKQTQKTVDIVVLKKDIERGKVIKEQSQEKFKNKIHWDSRHFFS